MTLPFNGAQRGYTLVELMVAITIAVFLLAGLFNILQQTRNTSNQTTGLSQLQDDERVAMSLLTNVIEHAGYAPEANASGQTLMIADGTYAYAGQAFIGSLNAPYGEKVIVRSVLGATDGSLDCLGKANATGADQVYKATLSVGLDSSDNSVKLYCSSNNGVTAEPLVGNIVSITFQYAVNSTSATSTTVATGVGPNTESSNVTGYGCPADTYIPTASMSAADWTNVCAVKVALIFTNPLYQPAGQPNPTPGQPAYVTFERVIGVLNRAGVNTTNITQT
jgi:type IV pilus assembly protein PilW